tara:strand:+ start:57561 stop:57857 length:297 start_codon:yes stop_codon:yes gene_type:complete
LKKIHTDRIKELSNLVKLKLTSEELKTLSVDLNDILDSFEKLNRLKINSFNEFDDDLKDKNITRKDINHKSWDKAILLRNAPNHDGNELNIEYVLGDD